MLAQLQHQRLGPTLEAGQAAAEGTGRSLSSAISTAIGRFYKGTPAGIKRYPRSLGA
jgi:hypothetical protein